MGKNRSLQWRLTLITAFIVIVSCLSISYFISKSAVLFFVEIEESAITMFPKEFETEDAYEDIEVTIHPEEEFSEMVKKASVEFWTKSILVTLLISLISSSLMYFIMGYALRPLQRLGKQIEEIQAKNLQKPVVLNNGSVEIIHLADAFNEMLKRLGDAFLAQKQFSANAAHELRTPLAVIRTKLEVFEKNKNLEIDECKETIRMVRTQTDQLSHVIDLLLEMTELQSANRSNHIQLADIIEEVICDLECIGDKRNIRLVQKPGDAQITGNDTLIYRAVYNLIENAIKYNREGGEVSVEVVSDNAYVKILVSDTGPGILQSDWERIFEPFFKADRSRSAGISGAGLGLALVKEIAYQHGGDVRVVQSSEHGTQIALMLRPAKNMQKMKQT